MADTRQALVDAARKLFTEQGFAATGTEEIVAAARVTRGALYHHFHDKTDLFRAVMEQIAREVAEHLIDAELSRPAAPSSGPRNCPPTPGMKSVTGCARSSTCAWSPMTSSASCWWKDRRCSATRPGTNW